MSAIPSDLMIKDETHTSARAPRAHSNATRPVPDTTRPGAKEARTAATEKSTAVKSVTIQNSMVKPANPKLARDRKVHFDVSMTAKPLIFLRAVQQTYAITAKLIHRPEKSVMEPI